MDLLRKEFEMFAQFSYFKSSTAIVVSAVLVAFLVACGSTPPRIEPSGMVVSSSDGAAVASIRVDGLGCPMCAESISILMKSVDGVQGSRVDLSTGIVTVDLDPSVLVSSAELRSAIDDGGFTFRSIEFTK